MQRDAFDGQRARFRAVAVEDKHAFDLEHPHVRRIAVHRAGDFLHDDAQAAVVVDEAWIGGVGAALHGYRFREDVNCCHVVSFRLM